MNAVSVRDLTYIYSEGTPFEKKALDGFDIDIEEGSIVGIIGHTGSGKSTFIRHLNGLLRPTEGKVIIGGRDIWEDPKKIRDFRFKVGLVFQYPEYQLFEETVEKDIAFGPKNMGLSQEEISKRVSEAAEAVGLSGELLARSPFELSGGQRRRAAIAGVLAMRPEVLVLDEPTAGLDPGGRDSILAAISDYHKKSGSTTLIVSHSMEDIARYTEKIAVINEGRLFAYGSVGEVYSRAEELSEIGLSVPQVSRIFSELSSRGYDLPKNIYTVENAADAIALALSKGGRR